MMGQKSLQAAEEVTTGKKSVTRSMHYVQDESADYSAAFRSSIDHGDGVIMMAVRDLFRQIAFDSDRRFVVSCSYLEIYNDSVHDLLTTTDKLGDELPIVEKSVGLP